MELKIEQTKITDKYLFFWGSIFSNFYPTEFSYKGHVFGNTEQAFMWRKAMFFYDYEIADKILKNTNPQEVKGLGRKVKNYDDNQWSKARYKIMLDVNLQKFKNKKLQEILLSTKDLIIVESSPVDKIWGVGLSKEDPLILDENNWKGQNLLGEVLMNVRDYFKIIKNQEND